MPQYKVKYRVNNTNTSNVIHLINGSESEAISKLRQHYAVPQEATVIILSIEKV
jgi:hypothetical protein